MKVRVSWYVFGLDLGDSALLLGTPLTLMWLILDSSVLGLHILLLFTLKPHLPVSHSILGVRSRKGYVPECDCGLSHHHVFWLIIMQVTSC